MNLGGTIRLNRTGLCILVAIFILLMLYVTSTKNNAADTNNNIKELSLRQMLHSAIETAKRGGSQIRNLKGPVDVRNKGKTKEGVNDSVTNADIKSHCVMYHSLKQTFPHVRIVSEEEHHCEHVGDLKMNTAELGDLSKVPDVLVPVEDVTLWIDPLDATKEYTENLLDYVTTMVCVAVKGKPVIGVIHKPYSGKTSWAWVNKVHSDDLRIPTDPGVSNPKITISMSHAGEVESVLKKALGDSVIIVPAAGAGYKSLEVAAGNVTAYYHTTSIKKWDICAGNAILNALDGKMTTSFNDEIDYSNTGTGKVVNDKGLLGTIHNHDWYIAKLSKQKTQ